MGALQFESPSFRMSVEPQPSRNRGHKWNSAEMSSLLQFYSTAQKMKKKGGKHDSQKEFASLLASAMKIQFPDFAREGQPCPTKLRNISNSLKDVCAPRNM